MIMESIKKDGSLVFHGVGVFMVRRDGTLSVRDCDENLLDIRDFNEYARLRLLTDHGKVLHTVRDDVPKKKTVPDPAYAGDNNVIEPEEWR